MTLKRDVRLKMGLKPGDQLEFFFDPEGVLKMKKTPEIARKMSLGGQVSIPKNLANVLKPRRNETFYILSYNEQEAEVGLVDRVTKKQSTLIDEPNISNCSLDDSPVILDQGLPGFSGIYENCTKEQLLHLLQKAMSTVSAAVQDSYNVELKIEPIHHSPRMIRKSASQKNTFKARTVNSLGKINEFDYETYENIHHAFTEIRELYPDHNIIWLAEVCQEESLK